MITIQLNPGFALILGAALAFVSPRAVRGAIMTIAPLACLAMIFWDPFGDYEGFNQIGLTIARYRLDELSQTFGLLYASGALFAGFAAGQRRDRSEDSAILFMAGGATTAAFAGDLISFIAATELSTLAGAWIVLTAGGRASLEAGVRMLIWQGLGGLLLLCGVAFHLSEGFGVQFGPLPADSLGGAFFLAGLALKAGAPFAHVWFKDALPYASPAGAAAFSLFSVTLALYGLARGFLGEAMLTPAGLALAVIGALYALAEDDLRRALAYSLLAQIGLAAAALGMGDASAMAGAAMFAFTNGFAYFVLLLAVGAVVLRAGTARASLIGGLGARMPVTALFCVVAGLTAAGAPLTATALPFAMISDAVREGAAPAVWWIWTGAAGANAAFTAVRLPLAAFFGRARGEAGAEAPFAFLLPMAVIVFVLGAAGLAPGWLIGLAPPVGSAESGVAVAARQLGFVGAAMAGYGVAAAFGVASGRVPRRLIDADAFYRGPAAGTARGFGSVILRLYGASKTAIDDGFRQLGRLIETTAKASDRPYDAGALAATGSVGVFLLLLVVVFLNAS